MSIVKAAAIQMSPVLYSRDASVEKIIGIIRKAVRLLVGNPLIMREMARTVPVAAGYAPVTLLVVERLDGVHLSYDSLESLLVPYGNDAALAVARELDAKVVALMQAAAN